MNPDSANLKLNLLARTAAALILLIVLISILPRSPMARAWQNAPDLLAPQGVASRTYLPLIQIIPDPTPWGANQFGYIGLDNLNTRTPTFHWLEIAGSGTEVAAAAWSESSLGDSLGGLGRQVGPIPLGMYFPIFDAQYNAVWIHDAGNLRFGNAYSPGLAPVVRALTYPGGFTSGDSNYVPGQSHVYFQRLADPERFIVEYRGLRLCCADGTADLEVILYPSGDMRIQYLQLGDHEAARIAVGLFSILGTDALVYPAPPVAGRVVAFTYPPQPHHTYTPDPQRWYTFTLPRLLYAELNTLLLGPSDGSMQAIFVGGSGLLLRTETGGREWTVVTPSSNTTTGGENSQGYALSPDYAQSGVIMAVGRGLMRSANRGNSWAELGGPTGQLRDIAFSPTYAADRTSVAMGDTGIWMSTDAGLTWENRAPALVGIGLRTIRFSPDYAYDRTLWATTYAGPLYRSTDGGAAWSALALPSWAGQANPQAVTVQDLQPAPNYGASQRLFLLGQRGSYPDMSLYRSEDGGTSWRLLADVAYGSRLLRVDPTDATNQTLYLGLSINDGQSSPLQRSQDGGVTWQTFSHGFTALGAVTALNIQPESGHLIALANNFESTWLFARAPNAPAWHQAAAPSPNLRVVQPGISQDQTGNTVMWAGGYRSDDGGRTWAVHGNIGPGGVLRAVAPSPDYANDGTAIALTGSALLRTTDRGVSWASQAFCLGDTLSGEQRIALSPAFRADRTAFTVACDHIACSTDAGVTWQTILSGDTTTIGLSPDFAHDHTVFALMGHGPSTLKRSTDGGTTWASFQGPWWTTLLRISPTYVTDHTLYAGVNNSSGSLWRSTDSGESWSRLPPTPSGTAVTGFVVKPAAAANRSLFLANEFTPEGIAWLSDDGGQTWDGLSSGLGAYGFLQAYAYHSETDRLYNFNESGMRWRTMGWR